MFLKSTILGVAMLCGTISAHASNCMIRPNLNQMWTINFSQVVQMWITQPTKGNDAYIHIQSAAAIYRYESDIAVIRIRDDGEGLQTKFDRMLRESAAKCNQ